MFELECTITQSFIYVLRICVLVEVLRIECEPILRFCMNIYRFMHSPHFQLGSCNLNSACLLNLGPRILIAHWHNSRHTQCVEVFTILIVDMGGASKAAPSPLLTACARASKNGRRAHQGPSALTDRQGLPTNTNRPPQPTQRVRLLLPRTMDDSAAGRPSAHSRQPVMSFFDLPPEIRNIIYKSLFPKGRAAAQLLARRSGGGYIRMSDRFTLLETCRQIYEEVTSLLQGQQRFVVKQPKTLSELMDSTDGDGNFMIERNIADCTIPEGAVDLHYDLDRQVVNSGGVSMFHINRALRRTFAAYKDIRITASISVTGSLQRLGQWTQSGRDHIPDIDHQAIDYTTWIVLRVPWPSCDDGGNFEVDVAELASATDDLFWFTQMRTIVYHRYDEENTTPGDDQDLQNIKAGLLLFIHTLIKKSPDGNCPKIWMNRDLRVVFADMESGYDSIERVTNKNAACSWHRTYEYLLAADLVRYYHNMGDHKPHGIALKSVAKTLADYLHEAIY
jgi:hypothetical protein